MGRDMPKRRDNVASTIYPLQDSESVVVTITLANVDEFCTFMREQEGLLAIYEDMRQTFTHEEVKVLRHCVSFDANPCPMPGSNLMRLIAKLARELELDMDALERAYLPKPEMEFKYGESYNGDEAEFFLNSAPCNCESCKP